MKDEFLCPTCPAAFRGEPDTKGTVLLQCGMGSYIHPEAKRPAVGKSSDGMMFRPLTADQPPWCARKKAGNKVWINDKLKGD